MHRFIIRRLLLTIFVTVGAAILIFSVMFLIPGDPAEMLLDVAASSEAEVAAMRAKLGIDQPFLVQLGSFLYNGFLKFDFGLSWTRGTPVMAGLVSRIPRTFLVSFLSILVTVVLGVPLGINAAMHRNGWQDRGLIAAGMVVSSIPSFWLALLLIILFSLKLGWLPSFGIESWKCYILPVVCASLMSIMSLARQTRHSVLDVMNADYITTARAKGLKERIVIYKHMLPNALIPILTMLGGQLSMLIGGSIITEKIFSFPGIGYYMTMAVSERDYPIVRAGVILIAAFSALVMLAIDIVYGYIDPRIKAQYINASKKKGRIDRSRRGNETAAAPKNRHEQADWENREVRSTAAHSVSGRNATGSAATVHAVSGAQAVLEMPTPTKRKAKKESMLKLTLKRLAKDKVAILGLAGVAVLVLLAVLAPVIAPYSPDELDVLNMSAGPSAEHWFGTDLLGRDYLTRILYGGRWSLILGFSGAFISLFLGIVIGSIAGYFGGWADNVIMRLCDIIQSIPGGLVGVVLSIVMGTSFWVTVLALSLASVVPGIRMTRAQILSVRKLEYLDAARTVNCGTAEIIFKHILPNIFSPMLLGFTGNIGAMINQASGLSVIGLGVPPTTPEWGQMLSDGRNYMRSSPHLVLFPGLFMFFVGFCINLFGDGLRDALDPKLKK